MRPLALPLLKKSDTNTSQVASRGYKAAARLQFSSKGPIIPQKYHTSAECGIAKARGLDAKFENSRHDSDTKVGKEVEKIG